MSVRSRRRLAEHHDRSPLPVIDLAIVAQRYLDLVEALPGIKVFYAVKANPSPEVLSLLVGLGASFDVASMGEVELCLRAGAPPDRLSYGNTIKKLSAIERSHELGVRCFAFDSDSELDKLITAAAVQYRLETDPGGVVLALVAGEVRVVVGDTDEVAIVRSGSFIGELSAVDGLPRSASVVAVTDFDARAISALAFVDAIATLEPGLFLQVVSSLGSIRAGTETAAIRAGGAPVGLVSECLLRRVTTDTEAPVVELSLAEVAAELDVSHEHLSRAFDHLSEAGAVTLGFGRVLILDEAILRSLASRLSGGR